MFKINNKNTRTTFITFSGAFIVKFERISHVFLVFLLLTSSKQSIAGDLVSIVQRYGMKFQPFFTFYYIVFTFQDVNIGGYVIQQNRHGKPVALFRYPPRTILKSGFSSTVCHFLGIYSCISSTKTTTINLYLKLMLF